MLYRRVPPTVDLYLVWDDDRQCLRLSTAAFKDRDDEASVDVGDCLQDYELDPESTLGAFKDKGFGLVQITTSQASAVGAQVRRDPKPDNPCHGLILGKLRRAAREELCFAARWVVQPPGTCDPPHVRPEAGAEPTSRS
jgi:hypothetical protein